VGVILEVLLGYKQSEGVSYFW